MTDEADEVSAFIGTAAPLADGNVAHGDVEARFGCVLRGTIVGGFAIGALIAVPHLLDLVGATTIYSSASDGSSAGRAIIRIFDAIYVLLAVGIVMRRSAARIIFVGLSVGNLILLANGLDTGEQALPGSLTAIILQLAPTIFLMVPRSAGTFY